MVPRQALKIWFLSNTSVKSGAEVALISLIRCCKESFDLTLVTGEYGYLTDACTDLGVPIRVINLSKSVNTFRKVNNTRKNILFSLIGSLTFVWKLRKALVKEGPDILHCNTTKANVIGAIATIGLRTKLIWHIRDDMNRNNYSSFSFAILKFTSSFADGIIANSGWTLSTFVSWSRRNQNTAVIPSSVIYDPVFSQLKNRKFPSKNKPVVIASVSRIAPWKGQDVLIRAIPLISKAIPLEVWIIGGPLFGETTYEQTLKQLVVAFKLNDIVKFFGHQDSVESYWKQIDLFVHSPRMPEPFGQVIVEAQSHGIPIVVPRSGGLLEWVSHEENGVLFQPEDSESLAQAIFRILSDRDMYEKLSFNGLESTKRFSPIQVRSEVERIYLQLIETNRF